MDRPANTAMRAHVAATGRWTIPVIAHATRGTAERIAPVTIEDQQTIVPMFALSLLPWISSWDRCDVEGLYETSCIVAVMLRGVRYKRAGAGPVLLGYGD